MNTYQNPFFIFDNSLGNQIKCYRDKNLNSLWHRLNTDQKLEIKIYIEYLELGFIYGAEIKQ